MVPGGCLNTKQFGLKILVLKGVKPEQHKAARAMCIEIRNLLNILVQKPVSCFF